MIECPVCNEEYAEEDMLGISKCIHKVCKNCIPKIIKICYCDIIFGQFIYICPCCREMNKFPGKDVVEIYKKIGSNDYIKFCDSEQKQLKDIIYPWNEKDCFHIQFPIYVHETCKHVNKLPCIKQIKLYHCGCRTNEFNYYIDDVSFDTIYDKFKKKTLTE
jgi:hypothetical protein